MVNWKTAESTDRLFAAIIAAHPSHKLDYQAMATMFGQGATYDAIEGRFRRYRKMAEDLVKEARARGITEIPRGRNASSGSTTPRTPRGPRNGVTKPSSSGRGRKGQGQGPLASPSKRGSAKKQGMSIMDAIFLDDEDHSIPVTPKKGDADTKIKNELSAMFPNMDDTDLDIADVPASAPSVASTATTAKVDTPEAISSFTTSFGAVKPQDRVGNDFVDDFTSGFPQSPRPTANNMQAGQDVFNLPGFYFPHATTGIGYDDDINNMDDIYGGAA